MGTQRISVFQAPRPISMQQFARQVWAVGVAMVRARTTRRLLAEMDDRMLADVGVSRGDAMMEAARPFWALSVRR